MPIIPFNSRAEEGGNGTLIFPDKTATSSVENPKVVSHTFITLLSIVSFKAGDDVLSGVI